MLKNKWRILAIAIIFVLIVGFIVLSEQLSPAQATVVTEYELSLLGESEISLFVGDIYEEPGFIATNEFNEDLNDMVLIHSTVDTNLAGKYSVVYILNNIVKTRTITVSEKVVEIEPQNCEVTTPDFSEEIKLDYAYIQPDNLMPFGLIMPSTAKESEKIPLIISLHGQSERGCNETTFKNKFVINLMRNWEMKGFNAYVVFPHLTGKFYADSWNTPHTANNVFALIDWVVAHYNIDPDRIIIQGQSMGGYGCLYMAAYHPEYFAGCVPVSPYDSNVDLNKLKKMPVQCYVGHQRFGEDGRSASFATGKLQSFIGEENVNQREVSHNEIPIVAYTEDLNANNIPDLLEWMFEQMRQITME